MEDKYKEIYAKLKKETENTLENKNTQQYIQEFRVAVKSRLQEVHAKLDIEKEKIISMAIDAYKAQINKEVIIHNKKEEDDKLITSDFKSKINELMTNLDNIMQKTETIEDTIKVFQTAKINDLLSIKENELEFKYARKLQYKIMGKINWDIKWNKMQNKPENSNLDKDDDLLLNINANSCYNYYLTDKEIVDESVLITFETNIYQVNGYLYFGVLNENVTDLNNNCMCCNIPNAFYLKCDGNLLMNGSLQHYTPLMFKNPGVNTISLRIISREKEMYLKLNEGEEQGPFKISGKKFRITSGSCNCVSGYIRLVNALIIG